jgi:hypothetical protein
MEAGIYPDVNLLKLVIPNTSLTTINYLKKLIVLSLDILKSSFKKIQLHLF